MLSRVSSYELTEWMAFEQAYGPLGSRYNGEMLAAIHEQLQFANKMAGGEDYPEPKQVPRPNEYYIKVEDDEAVYTSVEEFDQFFDD